MQKKCDGRTALDLALDNRFEKVAALLSPHRPVGVNAKTYAGRAPV